VLQYNAQFQYSSENALRYLIVLILLFCLVKSVVANESAIQPLTVLLDLKPVNANQMLIDEYQQFFAQVFSRQAVFTTNERKNIDIIIANSLDVENQNLWSKSEYLLDVVPAFSITQVRDNPSIDYKKLGSVTRPYMHELSRGSYLIKDMDAALIALKNKRIDGIIDYTKESSYYVFDNPELVQVTHSEKQPLSVFFKSSAMRQLFESFLDMRPITPKNNQLGISPAPSKAEKTLGAKDLIQLYLIPKQLDPETNKLQVASTDAVSSQWLISHLNNYQIQTQQGTTNQAFELLAKQDNVCVLNTFSGPERKKIAVFSLPTYVYLNFQLYVQKNGLADQTLKQWVTTYGNLNLKDYFAENKSGLVGYYEYINRTSGFASNIAPFIQQDMERFSKLTVNATQRSLRLLDMNRIEYLIAYPLILEQYYGGGLFDSELNSYSFEHYDKFRPVYVSCSQSVLGNDFILSLNRLLKNKQNRQSLTDAFTQKMLPSDKKSVTQIFEQLYAH
jgi:uncharacterized protein (TIGR02285 family)